MHVEGAGGSGRGEPTADRIAGTGQQAHRFVDRPAALVPVGLGHRVALVAHHATHVQARATRTVRQAPCVGGQAAAAGKAHIHVDQHVGPGRRSHVHGLGGVHRHGDPAVVASHEGSQAVGVECLVGQQQVFSEPGRGEPLHLGERGATEVSVTPTNGHVAGQLRRLEGLHVGPEAASGPFQGHRCDVGVQGGSLDHQRWRGQIVGIRGAGLLRGDAPHSTVAAMRLRFPVATAFLAVSLLFAPSCSDNSGDSVAVLGDSITSLDQADLNSTLGGDYELTISGNFGKTVSDVMPEAELMATRTYDQVIINLGTNDVLQERPIDKAIETLGAEVALFDSARCIHLVNINEHMLNQSDGASRAEAAKAFNAELEKYAERTEGVSVIDWNGVASSKLNGDDPPTSELTYDTIHPTAEGFAELNDLYSSALGSCGNLI